MFTVYCKEICDLDQRVRDIRIFCALWQGSGRDLALKRAICHLLLASFPVPIGWARTHLSRVVTCLAVPVARKFAHMLGNGIGLIILGCLAIFAIKNKLTLLALPARAAKAYHALQICVC